MKNTKQEQTEKLLEELKSKIAEECSKHTFGEEDRRLVGLSEEEQKKILKEDFAGVYLFNGDAELISNCNSEYYLTHTESAVTNGCLNLSVMLKNRDKRAGKLGDGAEFDYVTCVRGGSFIIIVEPASSSSETNKYILYANRNTVEKDYREIKESLIFAKEYPHLIDEYIQKNGIHVVFDEAYARGYAE